jgi:glycosidase
MKAPRRKSDRTIASAHSGDAAVHVKGTPFFFAGDEIGMTDVPIAPECVQDVFEKLVPGYGLNRDPERNDRCADTLAHAMGRQR